MSVDKIFPIRFPESRPGQQVADGELIPGRVLVAPKEGIFQQWASVAELREELQRARDANAELTEQYKQAESEMAEECMAQKKQIEQLQRSLGKAESDADYFKAQSEAYQSIAAKSTACMVGMAIAICLLVSFLVAKLPSPAAQQPTSIRPSAVAPARKPQLSTLNPLPNAPATRSAIGLTARSV